MVYSKWILHYKIIKLEKTNRENKNNNKVKKISFINNWHKQNKSLDNNQINKIKINNNN